MDTTKKTIATTTATTTSDAVNATQDNLTKTRQLFINEVVAKTAQIQQEVMGAAAIAAEAAACDGNISPEMMEKFANIFSH